MKDIESLNEEWREISGYGGAYRVSNTGKVWSVSRRVRVGSWNGETTTRDILMSQRRDQKGYLRVYLNDRGRTRFVPVHRLVANAFIPNPEHKPQVNHIDGNKCNNNVLNLEWCTNSENQIHAYRLGLNRVTGKAGRPKISVIQIDARTNVQVNKYPSINEAYRQTGVHAQNINKVIKGTRKTAGGYKWKGVGM